LRAGAADVEAAERVGAVGLRDTERGGDREQSCAHSRIYARRAPRIYRVEVSSGAKMYSVSVGSNESVIVGTVREPPGTNSRVPAAAPGVPAVESGIGSASVHVSSSGS